MYIHHAIPLDDSAHDSSEVTPVSDSVTSVSPVAATRPPCSQSSDDASRDTTTTTLGSEIFHSSQEGHTTSLRSECTLNGSATDMHTTCSKNEDAHSLESMITSQQSMRCNPSFTDKSALRASAAFSLGETSPADTASPVRSSDSSQTVVHSCEQASQSGTTTSTARHERHAGPVSCERKAAKHNVPTVEEVHHKDDGIYPIQRVLAVSVIDASRSRSVQLVEQQRCGIAGHCINVTMLWTQHLFVRLS